MMRMNPARSSNPSRKPASFIHDKRCARILEFVEQLDAQAQAMFESGAALLDEVMRADDPLAALRERGERVDEAFMMVLSANAGAAQRAGQAAAASTFGAAVDPRSAGGSGGREAIAQYDYDKAEDNELQLMDGTSIVEPPGCMHLKGLGRMVRSRAAMASSSVRESFPAPGGPYR